MAERILITGASGFIAFEIIYQALQKGYAIRGTVRRQAQADALVNHPALAPFKERLECVLVPDLQTPGAFTTATRDVQYIIHTASPMGVISDDYVRDTVNPAVNGTLNILRAAQDAGSVKRVVNTNSAAAVLKWSTLTNPQTLEGPYSEKDIYEAPPPPYTHMYEAYWAAKAKTIAETRAWIADVKPQFGVVNVLPAFVLGRNLRATTPVEIFEGNTNGLLFGPLLGNVAPEPVGGTTVDVEDVARVCLESLTEKVKGHRDFLLSSNAPAGITYDDAIEIVKEKFPEAVEKGIFPLGGSQPTISGIRVDVGNAEGVFGKFKPFEEQVKTAVGQFVELATKEIA